MDVCVYQGSFNPIHNAHIEVAKYVRAEFGFEKTVFIPAFRPPHKPESDFDTENAIHRLNMVELAVKEYSYFDVSAIEYTRNKPSYTFDTISQISNIVKPEKKINFIIGSDAFRHIESWYRADELKKQVKFILFVREKNFNLKEFEILREKGYDYELMNMPFIDISSSAIREKIKKNEDISDMVPYKVAEYIKNNDVYKV